MKNIFNSALRCNRRSLAVHQALHTFVRTAGKFICSMVLVALFTGCTKQGINASVNELHDSNGKSSEATVLKLYNGLEPHTSWELQQARAATAKYRNFENAIKDGYADINVVIPEMGYHYLRAANLDDKFEFRKPEILVYNMSEDGSMQLVALEYAVPISLSPGAPPSGFTGNDDTWGIYQGQLWTLHAWVWKFNPEGVFNATNPSVHLH